MIEKVQAIPKWLSDFKLIEKIVKISDGSLLGATGIVNTQVIADISLESTPTVLRNLVHVPKLAIVEII